MVLSHHRLSDHSVVGSSIRQALQHDHSGHPADHSLPTQ